jgi:hypothetical protein
MDLVARRRASPVPPRIARASLRFMGGKPVAGQPAEVELSQALSFGAFERCDLVLSRPGARDFHGTIEPSERGPRLTLAADAEIRLNGRIVTGDAGTVGIMPGDTLEVGAERLSLEIEPDSDRFEWRLLSADQRATLLIAQPVHIGSDADCQLRLSERDIAPKHARLMPLAGLLWIQDLSEAGTFVNDEPVRGAMLLADGDRLRVGTAEFHVTALRRAGTTGRDALPADGLPAEAIETSDDTPHSPDERWPMSAAQAQPTFEPESAAPPQRRPLPSPTRPVPPARGGRRARTERSLPRGNTRADARFGAAEPSERELDEGWIHPASATVPPEPAGRPRVNRARHERRERSFAQRVLPALSLLATFVAGLLVGLMLDSDRVGVQMRSTVAQVQNALPNWFRGQITALRDGSPASPPATAPPTATVSEPEPAAPAHHNYTVAVGTINTLRDLLRDSPGDPAVLSQLAELSELYRFLGTRAADQGNTEAANQFMRLSELAAAAATSAPTAPQNTPRDEANGTPAAAPVDREVAQLWQLAADQQSAGRLSAPAGDNVIASTLALLARQPEHADARALLNQAVDMQLDRAKRMMARRAYEGAATILTELERAGIAAADDGATHPWLDAEQSRDLHVVQLIIEADNYLQQSAVRQSTVNPGPQLRAAVAANPSGELTPRTIMNIGDILAVAAREARWAGRDQEAQDLQDLQQRLSAQIETAS